MKESLDNPVQNTAIIQSKEQICSTENDIEHLSPKYSTDNSIKENETTKWNKVLEYMKQNPDVLLNLIANSNTYKYGYVTNMKIENNSDYIEPTDKLKISPQCDIKQNTNIIKEDETPNQYQQEYYYCIHCQKETGNRKRKLQYSENVPLRRVMRTRMKVKPTLKNKLNSERAHSFLK